MIADLKPYAQYKDSGVPWLGQVPRHWEMRPAFGVFSPNHVRNHGMKEKTVLSLSYGRIVIKPPEKLHGLVPESFETYQIVNPGDIIIRTTDLQNDRTSLRLGLVRDRGIITSAYLALRPTLGVSPEFGFQFLNVWDMSKAIYGYGSGLRQNLDFSHFKRMPVLLPSSADQAAIVQFLDRASGRLQRAILAKRKVIALLNEQKQAIIQRAVTRGFDPSVPLKPSGVPWLGDIPRHWSIVSWRRLILSLKDFGSNGSFAGLRANVR
jgi:type I restriction enzyme, S subunit